jgi:hypothetical protein
MKYFLVSSFFGFILLFLTTSDVAEKLITPKKEVLPNPLDRILGEKIVDNVTLRKGNFDSILHIKASFLNDTSGLYTIQKLSSELFLLVRKRYFHNTRNYSLFVKTNGNKITSCYPLNDFSVKDALVSGKKIYFISDDRESMDRFWKPTYSVKITCLDLNFQGIWQLVSNADNYFFYAMGLSLEGNELHARIELHGQGSSTMCTDIHDVQLTKSGKIMDSKFLGTHACRGRNVPELDDVSVFLREAE